MPSVVGGVVLPPQRHFQGPKPVKVTLFGIKVFADVIKDLDMRLFWIRIGPESNDSVIYERKKT